MNAVAAELHPLDKRGWAVAESSCWEWSGSRDRDGYGKLSAGGKMRYAHRLAYERWVGVLIPGMMICHHCDNPPCINPAHLFQGTNADNVRDRDAKGRGCQLRGEDHRGSKLAEGDVREIRKLLSRGVFQDEIARMFGVSQSQISFIKRGRQWAWLDIVRVQP